MFLNHSTGEPVIVDQSHTKSRLQSSDLAGRRALVIVPAYNEEAAIETVLKDLRRHAPWADVLVVNDGSTDGTLAAARRGGARVLDLPVNLGIGGAVQSGFLYAYKQGYDLAFQFDGDGQHRARLLEALARPILSGEADLVVGSRFLLPRGLTARGMRLVGITILTTILSTILRQRITDPTSGFRGAGRKTIRFFARHYPQDYPEPESLVLVRRERLRIKEVPVRMRRRRRGVSSIGWYVGPYYMAKVVLAVLVDVFKAPVGVQGETEP
jgi:glycosyltransferase involved in cell wall biosynthesis